MGKRDFTTDDATTRDLLLYGRDHIKAAITLAKTNDASLYDSAAFLYHLGLEMILKTILLHESGKFQDEHKLVVLAENINKYKNGLISNGLMTKYDALDQFWNIKYPNRKIPVEIGDDDFIEFENMINATWELVAVDVRESIFQHEESKFFDTEVVEKGGRILMERPIL
ncbi:HEPN domain-containing protein [Methylomonas methanica]|uniref:HEPN domain protein n=1 Tax=Methylomonas methanica (strain DSM 25384 / MC09) TaxID=857087 RepID=F9ZWM6_METMM|nr:HEPN domain-containing protein [Methylomonas methanica]AEG00873.1 HEPN domain protein [Methylomonas methanica MC09]